MHMFVAVPQLSLEVCECLFNFSNFAARFKNCWMLLCGWQGALPFGSGGTQANRMWLQNRWACLAWQVITDARVYFQPAVDWRGEGTVRSHPLAKVAAVVRRRASLRPTGADYEASKNMPKGSWTCGADCVQPCLEDRSQAVSSQMRQLYKFCRA
jgi:hypothetical protein